MKKESTTMELLEDSITNMEFVHLSPQYKPTDLIISDLKFKAVVRNILKSKNILLIGYTGSAKTTTAKKAAEVLNRPFFRFNLGSMQDPRASLIGNTKHDPQLGTIFKEAEFVTAIKTKNAVILLDELSRAHADTSNILLTVTDHQRYLRLDEKSEDNVVNVAEGVTFIATANIGNEYTGTNNIDRATIDRFPAIIEMDVLTEEEEFALLSMKYPNAPVDDLTLLCKITAGIRNEFLGDKSRISLMVSTRMAEETAEYLEDKFTLAEALEITILPLYDKAGGTASERSFIESLIQTLIPTSEVVDPELIKKKISPDNIFAKNAGLV